MQQHDPLRVTEHAQDQHFGANRTDLPRREVHDRHYQPALEGLARVVGDLRRRALDADLGTEVDGELPGGLARLGEVLDANHAPDADVDALEVLERDLGAHGPGSPPHASVAAGLPSSSTSWRPPFWPGTRTVLLPCGGTASGYPLPTLTVTVCARLSVELTVTSAARKAGTLTVLGVSAPP